MQEEKNTPDTQPSAELNLVTLDTKHNSQNRPKEAYKKRDSGYGSISSSFSENEKSPEKDIVEKADARNKIFETERENVKLGTEQQKESHKGATSKVLSPHTIQEHSDESGYYGTTDRGEDISPRSSSQDLQKQGQVSVPYTDGNGYSGFLNSVKNGNIPLMESFLSGKATLLEMDKFKRNCFHLAAENNQEEILDNLITEAKTHQCLHELINAYDQFTMTPLHVATLKNHPQIIQILLNAGADPKQGDSVGQTCLHMVAKRGQLDLARILEAKGADFNIKTAGGKTAADLAREHGQGKMENFLQGKDFFPDAKVSIVCENKRRKTKCKINIGRQF